MFNTGYMELKKYLETREKKEFARMLGISTRALANYIDGIRLTPLDIAIKIYERTKKRVTFYDLYKTWRDKNE